MTDKKDEALKLALKALEYIDRQDNDRDFLSPEECCDLDDAITAIREALAEQTPYRAVKTWHDGKPVYVAEQPAQQQEPVAWCPDVCPITGLPFFMWIEHHETGQKVPTYGGPYDSYTIPARDKDGSYCRERYDHDIGWWVTDEVEDVGIQIVSDQAHVSDKLPASKPWVAGKTWVGLTEEEISSVLGGDIYDENSGLLTFVRAIEAKLREKNQ